MYHLDVIARNEVTKQFVPRLSTIHFFHIHSYIIHPKPAYNHNRRYGAHPQRRLQYMIWFPARRAVKWDSKGAGPFGEESEGE